MSVSFTKRKKKLNCRCFSFRCLSHQFPTISRAASTENRWFLVTRPQQLRFPSVSLFMPFSGRNFLRRRREWRTRFFFFSRFNRAGLSLSKKLSLPSPLPIVPIKQEAPPRQGRLPGEVRRHQHRVRHFVRRRQAPRVRPARGGEAVDGCKRP